MSTSKRKRRNRNRKGGNPPNAKNKGKNGGIPPPAKAGVHGSSPRDRREPTRTATGEQNKGPAMDRRTNSKDGALTTIDPTIEQCQTSPDRWNDRNRSQPDIPMPVVDRPNWNQQIQHEITIKTTKIISGIPDARPDDGNTPAVWRGMRIQYWLGLILFGITLLGAVVSKDVHAKLMELLETLREFITALNLFRR